MIFAISAMLMSHDHVLGCIGNVESCKTVKNRSKVFSSFGLIPNIMKEEESSKVTFKAPAKSVVSSRLEENEPVSEPSYENSNEP